MPYLAYVPCTFPEFAPRFMDDYPEFVEDAANRVRQCNERNREASRFNLDLVKGQGG